MRGMGLFLALSLTATFPLSGFAQEAEEEAEAEQLDDEAAEFLAGEEEPAPEGTGEADPAASPQSDPTPGTTDSGSGDIDDGDEAFLQGTEQPEIAGPEEEQGIGREEPEGMRFWMVGLRYRMMMVPGWLLNLFFDFPGMTDNELGGPFMLNQAVGVEFSTRRNNFSITGSVWWSGYFSIQTNRSGDSREFLAIEEGDPDDPEFMESTMSVMFFTADFVYTFPILDWFGITLGGGLGMGVVFGDLIRTEAYLDGGEYQKCVGEQNPDSQMCERRGGADDGYYGTSDSRVWPVVPWVNLIVGLRFKPMRHFEINVDGGVGLGFFWGVRASYIF